MTAYYLSILSPHKLLLWNRCDVHLLPPHKRQEWDAVRIAAGLALIAEDARETPRFRDVQRRAA